jgi:RES domain-containing protein
MSNAASGMAARIRAYRIVHRRFVATAFSGEGARLYGGRWNSKGVAVVYTSSTASLTILEWRANLTQWPAPPMVIVELEFDPALVWSPTRLPPNWKRYPYPKTNAFVGDSWVKSGRSAVLKLPSAIVSTEHNYLLNPAHPDFKTIAIGKQRVFRVDPRLVIHPSGTP